MSLDIGPQARSTQPREPRTVWVQTNNGATETTMPRPSPAFYNGIGAPTADVGADGSVYLDTKSGTFWGPKAAGQWPTAPIGKLQHAPHVLPA